MTAGKAISLTVAVGGAYKGIDSIKRSYGEALQALSINFILGANKDIYYDQFVDEINKKQSVAFDFNDLAAKITFDSRENVIESFESLITSIKKRGALSSIYMHFVFANIFIHAFQLLRAAEVDINNVFGNPLSIFENILAMETAQEKIEGLKQFLLDIQTIIESSRLNSSSAFIIKAEEYINENFSKKDLSLNDVTKHIAISQTHFCIEFKKKTGDTFTDYLTRIRMEKAKELLKFSSRKIYEIAEMVGYDNATYFSTLFKGQFQVTPSEFKAQYNVSEVTP